MKIAFVSATQHNSLIDLLSELNRFYHPDSPACRQSISEHAHQHLLSPGSPLQLLVANDEAGRVIGLAAFSLTYSLVSPEADRRRQCQLKELFVSADRRGQGIGHELMTALASYALKQGCQRIDWPVQASNAPGIAFYTSLGARQLGERLSFRLEPGGLMALAASMPAD